MSDKARMLGLVAALLMAAFSAYIYTQTGDWVAIIFCLGSVAYCLVFGSGLTKKN